MRNRAFLPLIEQILMIVVFAIVSAVCIGCFVKSREISIETELKDRAVVLAQNAAEEFKAVGLEKAITRYYDFDMSQTENGGVFTVVCDPIDDKDPFLETAVILVLSDEKPLFELKVCRQEGQDG